MDDGAFNAAIDQLMAGKKYRNLGIPRETFVDLLEKELAHTDKINQALKGVKAKLHNIIAPYLESLDYGAASDNLRQLLTENSGNGIKTFCLEMLRAHNSTRERIPYLTAFYAYLFGIIGENSTILDLACAMNPFCLPLVDLPAGTHYSAFDIHGQRITLIKQLFSGLDINGQAVKQDILVHPPAYHATAAFLFKEAHRIEKRESGASRKLVAALNAEHIFISLPSRSLNGKFDLRPRMSKLVDGIIADIAELDGIKEFPAEMIFHIRKING